MSGLVMLGVSGGVDSSVAALLLKQSGIPVAGLFMQNWEDDGTGECRVQDDRRDAVAVCGKLGIAFHTRNFSRQYWDGVFTHFIDEYRRGRTPNPDVLCNREIKFKTFMDEALALGADRIATGHYAQIGQAGGRWQLLRGADAGKDQSYFLHQLGQDQLARTLFPIGHLAKDVVRSLAREAELPTHAKKDSTGICFIGERDFRAFLGQYIPAQSGEIRSVDGERVGSHDGVFHYTLGQREGLAIGGVRGRDAAPWFVVEKDVERNILYVDQGHDSPWMLSRELTSEAAHWIDGAPPASRFACTAKTRYRQDDAPCVVEVLPDNTVRVQFAQPQRAVTPGQSLVLYDGAVCLGGAVISATDSPARRLLDVNTEAAPPA